MISIELFMKALSEAFDEGAQSPYEFKEETIKTIAKKFQSLTFNKNKQNRKKKVKEEIQESTCETDKYGTKRWRNNQGQLHRLDGPAVANGYKAWYQNGKRHRIDGPAVEYANGNKLYYVEGKCYSEEDFTKKLHQIFW